MSGYGLPKALELTLNKILQDSQLASYKIAGNGRLTTIDLRFDACMADTIVSPLHQSTPKSYCWKSPSKLNKDIERYVNLRREEMDHQNNSPSKRNETAAMNEYIDDSALHSLSLLDTASLTRETAQRESKQKVLLKNGCQERSARRC